MKLIRLLDYLKPLGFGIALGLSIPFSFNFYNNHNVDYQVGERRVLRKIDGIFSHTEVEVYDSGEIKVTMTSPYRSYTDKNGDLTLDHIYLGGDFFGRGPETESRTFDRENKNGFYDGSLETDPEVFVNSEREFKEQLKRFGLSRS